MTIIIPSYSHISTATGIWPQMRLECRMNAITRLVAMLKMKRGEIINTLMWEICKSTADATAEFDRTMILIQETIAALRKSDEEHGQYVTISGITARVRRNAVGVVLLLGPFNYPVCHTFSPLFLFYLNFSFS